jgi:hypothetical protein
MFLPCTDSDPENSCLIPAEEAKPWEVAFHDVQGQVSERGQQGNFGPIAPLRLQT